MLHSFDRDLEITERLETEYVRALFYDLPADYSEWYRSYEYPRLCTVLEGEVIVSQKEGLRSDNNKFLLMPAMAKIWIEIKRPAKALVYELSDVLIKKVSENTGHPFHADFHPDHPLLLFQESSELRNILNKIQRTLAGRKPGFEYILDVYAQELVYDLIQTDEISRILNFRLGSPVSTAIQYMEEEYNGPISIKRISCDLGMSEANFCQYFKKITGVSPKEYLTHIKMEKAKEIIMEESITDASFDLGYESVSNFISTFKEVYGVTPKQYKKKSGY
jgi:AraC-like DNA-binding protein